MITASCPTTHVARHRIGIDAPPRAVWRVVGDVFVWPIVFGPTVHVERLSEDDGAERIQLWATANGQVRTWTSRRELEPDAFRITFRQDGPRHPVAAMGGAWELTERADGGTEVVLLHDFRAVDDDPAGAAWIAQAVDHNSEAELAALKKWVEAAADTDRVFTFTDTVRVAGAADDVYAFLRDAHLWTQRLPHVAHLDVEETAVGVQRMAMDTRTADGAVHTTESIRVCLPERIVYKQTVVPALMAGHTGEWRIQPVDDGTVLVSSRHDVALRCDAIEAVLGPDASVAAARAYVHGALSRNSTTTLHAARDYAERLASGRG